MPTSIHPLPLQAALTFSPLPPSASPSPTELESVLLPHLYACPTTSQFFTLPQSTLTLHPRPSRSAKQLFCPQCPTSPLTLTPPPIRCPTCPYTPPHPANTPPPTPSDLLLRDADPFPWLTSHLRAMIALSLQHHDPKHNPATAAAGPTDNHHHLTRTASLHHTHRPIATSPHPTLSPAAAAAAFTTSQAVHERRVFETSFPESVQCKESREWMTGSRRVAMEDGYAAAGELVREGDLERMVDRKDRMDGVTWWKRDLCARRRVLLPKVVVRSPWGEGMRGWRAERVMPEVRVWDEGGDLRVGVRNVRGGGRGLKVWLGRAANGDVGEERFVEGGGEVEVVWEGGAGGVVSLDLRFRYEEAEGGRDMGGEWGVRVFARWEVGQLGLMLLQSN